MGIKQTESPDGRPKVDLTLARYVLAAHANNL